MTFYRDYCINLEVLDVDLFNVWIDGIGWSKTVAGEENAIDRGKEYIDAMIEKDWQEARLESAMEIASEERNQE